MLKVKKYSNNARMEELAKDNMPFMGLEIHGLVSIVIFLICMVGNGIDFIVLQEEYTLPPDLPHTSGMRQRGVKLKSLNDLLSARYTYHILTN